MKRLLIALLLLVGVLGIPTVAHADPVCQSYLDEDPTVLSDATCEEGGEIQGQHGRLCHTHRRGSWYSTNCASVNQHGFFFTQFQGVGEFGWGHADVYMRWVELHIGAGRIDHKDIQRWNAEIGDWEAGNWKSDRKRHYYRAKISYYVRYPDGWVSPIYYEWSNARLLP